MSVSKEEMQQIADAAAERVLSRVFLTLGIDITDPQSILRHQKDSAYLRAWRESMEAVRGVSLRTAITVVITGLLAWAGMWWRAH